MDNQRLDYEKPYDSAAAGDAPATADLLDGGTGTTPGSAATARPASSAGYAQSDEPSGSDNTGSSGGTAGQTSSEDSSEGTPTPPDHSEKDEGDSSDPEGNGTPVSGNDSDPEGGETGGGDSEGGDPEGGDREGGDSGEGGDDPGDNAGDDGKEEALTPPPVNKFDLRFLTAPPSGEGSIDLKERRRRLSALLIRMALRILNEEFLPDDVIPLMDATLAHEAIIEARREGEIAGRNAVIEEQMLPSPAGAPDLHAAPVAAGRRRATSIFDLADLAR